jgi:G3E family GTPase
LSLFFLQEIFMPIIPSHRKPSRNKPSRKSKITRVKQHRLVIIGGFLGAGKTTGMLALARGIESSGRKCAMITNDQSSGLVDSAMTAAQGGGAGEITGGCFCCRADELIAMLRRIAAESAPDVILAEPVGSCTDLAATVTNPLRRVLGSDFSLAPLLVLVDAQRLWRRYFGRARGGQALTRDVTYILDKQLEEAHIIAVNKVDLLSVRAQQQVQSQVRTAFPQARVAMISAAHGIGMEELLKLLEDSTAAAGPGALQEIDYQRYARGESELGWLNGEWEMTAAAPVNGTAMVRSLARGIQKFLAGKGCEIGHLKTSLTTGDDRLAVANAVTSRIPAKSSVVMTGKITGKARLLVNVRAQAAPALLRQAVAAATRQLPPQVTLRRQTLSAFRPAAPVPRYVERGLAAKEPSSFQ